MPWFSCVTGWWPPWDVSPRLAARYGSTVIAGRSHNVAAQATTLGKRFANAGQELLIAFNALEDTIESYPLRGIKGPVGTQGRPTGSARGRSRGVWPGWRSRSRLTSGSRTFW